MGLKIFRNVFIILLISILSIFGMYLWNHDRKRKEIEAFWKERRASKIRDFGSVKTLSILPLVNWHKNKDGFRTEMGVSYLIVTDGKKILFDVAHNAKGESPSPLIHNMKELGISIKEIDTIFLSHLHFDHVGGKKWEKNKTFSLDKEQIDLSGKEVFAPVEIRYPKIKPRTISETTVLFPGIASLGPIPRQLFMGRIDEQALAIHVQGKGIVLISGCGHQTLPKLIEELETVFEEKIYGIVGDLHYPVPEGRLQFLGLNLQKIFASGSDPFHTIEEKDVEEDIRLLKNKNIALIGVGGHDSSDDVIFKFENEFKKAYRKVRVGDWIHVATKPDFERLNSPGKEK
ncbi:MBL fold metallo-hydrolase [Leptospira sp. 201903070]|uniref:MBL fold metallo-hydrolase n=1 Tax=Leptospira ainlahdjerensis TaxID=2810033 RepID=A0ABS2UEA8_9LEPT|nr:MBL fold metallo-hydrolase [Leptospira ainlahdjerensis]MBM9578499.1 MBL fold metallo-hydrolase [Leptospira ainlahdjerensis]